MKIIVFSDSHRYVADMTEATRLESPGYILHLGDHERDCAALRLEFPDIPLRAVRGNCDGFSQELDVDEFVLEGKRFVMTHGHLYGVKQGLARLLDFGEARQADILLFGHTHRAHFEMHLNMNVINPGSIDGSRAGSYAIITIENGKVAVLIKSVIQ